MASPFSISRQVLIAVEVFDPLSNSLLSTGLSVTAAGLDRMPIINASGRFVWLRKLPAATPDKWPPSISIDPGKLPFEPQTIPTPAPPDIDQVEARDRLVRVVLQPTAAADFAVGVTAIRGQLFETEDKNAAAVTDARIQLAWSDGSGGWIPAAPATAQDAGTNAKGEFGAFFRLASSLNPPEPDIKDGLIAVRLQLTRGGVTKSTPQDYPFLADATAAGRIKEGQLLSRDLKLSWAKLN